ncbi:MAG: hypothetical protein LUH54_02005, partial [Firmicutes bacterium]|nr:hypothetical protein [Bacillota bacterium]
SNLKKESTIHSSTLLYHKIEGVSIKKEKIGQRCVILRENLNYFWKMLDNKGSMHYNINAIPLCKANKT